MDPRTASEQDLEQSQDDSDRLRTIQVKRTFDGMQDSDIEVDDVDLPVDLPEMSRDS